MDLKLLILIMLHVNVDEAGKCPIKNCGHCTSTDECSVCNVGWFGKTCEYQCRGNHSTCLMCSDSFLRKNIILEKNCFGCQSNEYISNGECSTCPKNCFMCSGVNDCLNCDAGYFGKSCQNECPSHCASCESVELCMSCEDEWQGDTCQCSPYCLKMGNTSEWCSMNGTCEHGCLKGKTGRMCDLNCERKDVCIECDQFSKRCMKCTNGWYGTNCNKTCGHCSPDDKGAIACDIVSGECRHGCTHGFFGTNCDIECSPGCHDPITNSNKCDKETGHCIFGCIPGMYGDKCDMNCSSYCSNNTCHRKTGHCENGCVREWYGLNCTYACSNTCLNQSCNVTSGYCDIGCEVGWYGDSCNDNCSKQCANKSCERQSGLCDNEERSGDNISNIVSKGCVGKCKYKTCNRQTSVCLRGCEVGYEGHYCNETIQTHVGAIVILTSGVVTGTLIVLSVFFVICFGIRHVLCTKPTRRSDKHMSKKKSTDSIYDEIRENEDEMTILTRCTDDNVYFDTIADSVIGIDNCSTSNKDKYYCKMTDKKDRYNEYTDLTDLGISSSRQYTPELPPRNECLDEQYYAITDDFQISEKTGSPLSKDPPNGRKVSDEKHELNLQSCYSDGEVLKAGGKCSTRTLVCKRVNLNWKQSRLHLKTSKKKGDCDYLHPVC